MKNKKERIYIAREMAVNHTFRWMNRQGGGEGEDFYEVGLGPDRMDCDGFVAN